MNHKKRNHWTKEEDDTIRQYASTHEAKELANLLPRHSLGSIYTRSYRLGVKLKKSATPMGPLLNGKIWTDEENVLLRQCVGNVTPIDEMITILGKTKSAIRDRAKRMNLVLDRKRRKKPASEAETHKQAKLPPRSLLVQLRQGGMTFREIGELYGMSIDTVYLAFRRGKSEQARFEHGQTGA